MTLLVVRVEREVCTRGCGWRRMPARRWSGWPEKLAVLVPPPRMNTVLYAGVFAANHRLRKEVVPKRKPERPAVIARRRARKLTLRPEAGGDGRDSWAELLRRVFAKDDFQ